MKVKLNESLSSNKTLLVLSLFSIFTALLCVVLSDVLLPVLVALLASLLCFEAGTKKIFTYSTLVAVLVINIVGGLFIRQFLLFWGVFAIALSLIIYYFCVKGKGKMECVFSVTILYALFIVLSFIVFAMMQTGKASFSSAGDYYLQVIEKLRIAFVNEMYAGFSKAYDPAQLGITHEMLSQAYDAMIGNIISYVFIVAFCCSGICFKIFQVIALKLAQDKDYIAKWRFATPSLYAYFYMLLIVVSLFAAAGGGVLAVCVSNLYNIFMVIFAYIGFNFAHAFLARKRRPVIAFIMLLIITLLLFNFAIEILAMIGAFGTIRKNKEITA